MIDSHTGGEPTRIIISGMPNLGVGTTAQHRQKLQSCFDHYRRALCNEPRGCDVMVGALLLPPTDPAYLCGVVFFNNVGYLGMCGHGTIGLIETLRHLERIEPGAHRIQTPVGDVIATLHTDGRVSVENVPARRLAKDVSIEVPGYGTVVGDIAWGGNWFFLIDGHGLELKLANVRALTAYTSAVMDALAAQGIRGDDDGLIDHIELFARPSSRAVADVRNFVLCPGGAYDRSPCGTGTSAKLACLAADGRLAPGDVYRQESIVGSVFEASYTVRDGQTIPTITGRAYVNADLTVIFDPRDPFAHGISE